MNPDLRKLFLASFAGKMVYALSSLAALPILTWMLGQEAVGLLGFFTSVLMVFMALDGGLTSSVTRELASLSKLKKRAYGRYRLLVFSITNTYFLVFILLGVLVSIVIGFSANYLAGSWLQVEDLSLQQVQASIMWMGFFIGLSFPVMVLQAALQGREMQVHLNILYIPYALTRTLGVIFFLYLLGESASVELYFVFQVVLQFLYLACLLKVFCGKNVARSLWARPSWRFLKRGFGFGVGVLMISLTSVVIVQIDKLYLSGRIALGDYAVYALASTFAGIPYVLSSSLYATLYPRFSSYSASGELLKLSNVFRSAFSGFTIVLGTVCIAAYFFVVYPLNIIFESSLAESVAEIIPVLLIGTALQSLLIIPFALQLAVGWTGLTLRINLVSIPFIVFALPLMVGVYGPVGAAWVWLGYNLFAFFITMYFVLMRFSFLRNTVVNFINILIFLLVFSIPIFCALESFVFPLLSDFMVVFILAGYGFFIVAMAAWLFRKDLAGFV